MAIQAPNYIMPEPVEAALKGFEVADRSARDYARIMLEQQRFAEQAVENAKKAKADDFNSMMDMMKFNNTVGQQKIENAQRNRQLDISEFSADTGRYRAQNPSSRSARDPNAAARAFLGQSAPVGEDVTEVTDEVVSEGPLLPPNMGGEFGSGIDSNVSNRNNPALRQLERDAAIWSSGGDPDADLPTGGGGGGASLVENAPPTPTPDATPVPRAVPIAEVVPESPVAPAAPSDAFRDNMYPAGGPTAASSAAFRDNMYPSGEPATPAPSSANYSDMALGSVNRITGNAMDAVEKIMPSSFTAVDVTQDDRNRMLSLFKENAGIKQKITTARAKAVQAASYMRTVTDPQLAGQLSAARDQAAAEAEAAAGKAVEAQYKSLELQKQQALNQARQDKLVALSHMDDILPGNERSRIIAEAKDPRTAAMADRKIAVMNDYDTVRQAHGLTYKSNGLKTAEKVARLGLELQSPAALKDKEEYDRARVYEKMIEKNATAGDNAKGTKAVEVWENKLAENEAGKMAWEDREKRFKAAVDADTVKEKGDKVVAADIPVRPAAPAAAAAAPLPAIDSRTFAPSLPDKPETWQAAKKTLLDRTPGLEAELRRIAAEKPLFRRQAIRNALAKLIPGQGLIGGYTNVVNVDRTGPDLVDAEEVAVALVEEFNPGRAPQKVGQWTITRK